MLSRTDGDPYTTDEFEGKYTENDLLTLQDQARRSRDLFIILSTLGYGLNIVDAIVDAHLSTFDISDDLSIRIRPHFQLSPYPTACLGFTVKMHP